MRLDAEVGIPGCFSRALLSYPETWTERRNEAEPSISSILQTKMQRQNDSGEEGKTEEERRSRDASA